MSKKLKVLGDFIRLCRHAIYPEMSCSTFAKLAHISFYRLSLIEQGEIPPTSHELANIESLLHLPLSCLIELRDKED